MDQSAQLAVVDFGGQYAHLIAKRVRDLGVYADILQPNAPTEQLEQYGAMILSGGPASVYGPDAPDYNPALFERDIPLLGICYGHQLMAHHLGGQAAQGRKREDGFARIQLQHPSPLFEGWATDDTVWMSHGVEVTAIPEGFDVLASTQECPIAAMQANDKPWFGIQFHAEVTHTPKGNQLFDNFLRLSGLERKWSIDDYIPRLKQQIIEQARDKCVFMLLSGGVDSTVCFLMLNQALGKDRVVGLHVDTGLMRKHESRLVEAALRKLGWDNFHVVNAEERFLKELEGVTEPEQKRHIIGKLFLEVQRAALADLKLDPEHWLLGQGTLYPDTIESGGTKHADTIKTHHNRIPEIDAMIEQGRVIEPVKELYKDEVRKLGAALGLPDHLVWRHTFPGPGLAVQSLCSDGVPTLQEADKIRIEAELNVISQEFGYTALLLPIRSVGVQGDGRTYTHVAALTGEPDWSRLAKCSTRLTNGVREVNRVVYLLEPQQPDWSQLRLKSATLTKARLDLHREADFLANELLQDNHLERELYEFPVIMAPIGFGEGESIVLRPLYSENVMTVEFAKLPWTVVNGMADKIIRLEGIDAVFYDVTNKPPGTVQWE